MRPILRFSGFCVAVGFALGSSRAAAADWEVKSISQGKKNACSVVSGKQGLSDGYQQTTAWIVVDDAKIALHSDSVLDFGSSDIGLKVGNREIVRADRIDGSKTAVFTSGYANLVQLFKAGREVQVQLRFWPTWPATGTHSVSFSLLGFTLAYEEATKCG